MNNGTCNQRPRGNVLKMRDVCPRRKSFACTLLRSDLPTSVPASSCHRSAMFDLVDLLIRGTYSRQSLALVLDMNHSMTGYNTERCNPYIVTPVTRAMKIVSIVCVPAFGKFIFPFAAISFETTKNTPEKMLRSRKPSETDVRNCSTFKPSPDRIQSRPNDPHVQFSRFVARSIAL